MIGFLFFALFVVSVVSIAWLIAHTVKQQIGDPYVQWQWRKYPRVYWLFMTQRPKLAAKELQSLLLERPADRETTRLLAVACERMGAQDAA